VFGPEAEDKTAEDYHPLKPQSQRSKKNNSNNGVSATPSSPSVKFASRSPLSPTVATASLSKTRRRANEPKTPMMTSTPDSEDKENVRRKDRKRANTTLLTSCINQAANTNNSNVVNPEAAKKSAEMKNQIDAFVEFVTPKRRSTAIPLSAILKVTKSESPSWSGSYNIDLCAVLLLCIS